MDENDALEKKFDSYCKKVLRNQKIDLERKRKRDRQRFLSFEQLSKADLDYLSRPDNYEVLRHVFYVCGIKVVINNSAIAKAIFDLEVIKQKIILLAYFVGFNDREIALILNLSQDQVWYRRTSAIKQIEQSLEGLR